MLYTNSLRSPSNAEEIFTNNINFRDLFAVLELSLVSFKPPLLSISLHYFSFLTASLIGNQITKTPGKFTEDNAEGQYPHFLSSFSLEHHV